MAELRQHYFNLADQLWKEHQGNQGDLEQHMIKLEDEATAFEKTTTKLLIDVGKCDVNIQDCDLHTPLHLAAFEGSEWKVELLLWAAPVPADPTRCDKWGRTPYQVAELFDHIMPRLK
jgi:ankyrin repeat protein